MRGKINAAAWHDQAIGTVLYAGCTKVRQANLYQHLTPIRLYRVTHKFYERSHSWNSVYVGGTLTPITDGVNPPYGTWTNANMASLLQGA
jgi:hypothetical protein